MFAYHFNASAALTAFVATALIPAAAAGQTVATQVQPAKTLSGQLTTDDDLAKSAAEIESEARTRGEILVVANRIRGQLDVPERPIEILDEQDIASYGATSLSDLLAALSPQTGSGRGRASSGPPIMLVNGQRIANFREMRNFPPEAIRRMEILPEEVALRYGYPPNARVVNMVLKDSFTSRTLEAEYSQPDRGGTSTPKEEASLFNVNGPRRLSIAASFDYTNALTESARRVLQAIVPTVQGDPDPATARTLISSGYNAGLNATWTTGFGKKGLDGGLTLNAALSSAVSHGLSGLNTVVLTDRLGTTATRAFGDPLRRDNRTDTVQGSMTLNKPLGEWQLSGTVDAGQVTSNTTISRRADSAPLVLAASAGTLPITGALPVLSDAGFDFAHSVNTSLTSLLTVSGRPLHLPAGDASLTLRGGFAWTRIASDDTRSMAGQTVLNRGDASAGINLALPITSRRDNVMPAIGDLTLNISAGIDRLSDFGILADWTGGLTWGITEKLGFQASYIVDEQAPALSALGNPVSQSYNVPIYDFSRGETALVTVTIGGNPALRKERDRDLKLGVNWQMPFTQSATFIAEYFRNNSDNVTASFPVLTPAIESAFPGRVARDNNGRLKAIDQRSVTFANGKASRLRWGFNLSGRIGKTAPGAQGFGDGRPGGPFGGPIGGGGRVGGPGGQGSRPMMGRGPGGGQSRWNLSVFHTVQFSNRVLVTSGGPVLNLLDGDALTGGGVARHTIELEGGAFYKGVGFRLNGTWTGATKVKGSGAPGTSDLRFGSLAKLNMRIFVDLGQQKWLAKDSTFLKGARLSLYVNNILDERQKVTDQKGVVPVSYQPDLIDPLGRVLGIELRKQF